MILERMKNSERVAPVYSAGDYSYRNTKLCGDRWMLAGDAAGFIDPVFSSGVFLAIMSAEKAADVLDEILRDESRKSRLFQSYARRVNKVMDMYLTFVSSWYGGKEFMEVFLNPTEALQIAPAINAVLAGNEARSFAIKWRMWLFYFFVRAQRFVALSPRLSFIPKKADQPIPDTITATF
jgi:flavin-dependent dehydrogenase